MFLVHLRLHIAGCGPAARSAGADGGGGGILKLIEAAGVLFWS